MAAFNVLVRQVMAYERFESAIRGNIRLEDLVI